MNADIARRAIEGLSEKSAQALWGAQPYYTAPYLSEDAKRRITDDARGSSEAGLRAWGQLGLGVAKGYAGIPALLDFAHPAFGAPDRYIGGLMDRNRAGFERRYGKSPLTPLDITGNMGEMYGLMSGFGAGTRKIARMANVAKKAPAAKIAPAGNWLKRSARRTYDQAKEWSGRALKGISSAEGFAAQSIPLTAIRRLMPDDGN